ncbi:MAG: hypothetical protein V8Q75_02280 [Bacilli bacterium]
MKQMMKSKLLIGFMVMMLGITYVNSMNISKLEDTDSDYKNVIAMNID